MSTEEICIFYVYSISHIPFSIFHILHSTFYIPYSIFCVIIANIFNTNCIFNQINGAFHNYLSLYIGDNDNNTTFVGSYCLFVALVVTFAPSLGSCANVTTRATNKQYALQKSCYCLILVTYSIWLFSSFRMLRITDILTLKCSELQKGSSCYFAYTWRPTRYDFAFRLSFWPMGLFARGKILARDSLTNVAQSPLHIFWVNRMHQDDNCKAKSWVVNER